MNLRARIMSLIQELEKESKEAKEKIDKWFKTEGAGGLCSLMSAKAEVSQHVSDRLYIILLEESGE